MSTRPMPPAGDDRELLSALFDGELDGDPARFALKRLGHDAEWRATCERWQRVGEALRGRGAALTSHGLADRVALAVAAEPPLTVRTPVSHGWRIGGFAIAASIAAAALFLAQPQLPQAPAQDAAQDRVAAATSSSPPAPAAAISPVLPMAAAANEAVARPADSGPVFVAARSVSQTAVTSPQRPRSRPAPSTTPVASGPPEEGIAAALAPDPFTGGSDVAVRPWPRAVLPKSGSPFQAGYDPDGPSFHPFQPRALGQVDMAPDLPAQD